MPILSMTDAYSTKIRNRLKRSNESPRFSPRILWTIYTLAFAEFLLFICRHNADLYPWAGYADCLIKSAGRHTWNKKNPDKEMRAKIIDCESEGGLAPRTPYSHIYYCNCAQHRVHTEWQWPLSGVHYIMMVKSAQPGEVGGVHALPLSLYLVSTNISKVVVYVPAAPIFPLPLYVLCGPQRAPTDR